MHQEIMLQLPGHHEDCIEQLLCPRVPCLSILKDLADKIHMLLLDFHRGLWPFNYDDSVDNCIGGGDV
jgi:hypothetical protein